MSCATPQASILSSVGVREPQCKKCSALFIVEQASEMETLTSTSRSVGLPKSSTWGWRLPISGAPSNASASRAQSVQCRIAMGVPTESGKTQCRWSEQQRSMS